jgi:hypothetical protein
MRGRFFEDNGASTHHRFFTHYSAREYDGADPDMRETTDSHPAAEDDARRDMDVRADSTVVFDHRSAVDDAVLADHRAGVYNYSGHHDGPTPDARAGSDDGTRMNQNRRRKPAFQCEPETPGAGSISAHRGQESAPREAWHLLRSSARDAAITKRNAVSSRVVIDEIDALEATHASRDIQNDLSMSSRAPDQ